MFELDVFLRQVSNFLAVPNLFCKTPYCAFKYFYVALLPCRANRILRTGVISLRRAREIGSGMAIGSALAVIRAASGRGALTPVYCTRCSVLYLRMAFFDHG